MRNIILHILRCIVAFTFIASSILKLLSLQNFELYVYSFGIFNYVTTTFVVRVLLVVEFLLGIGLLFRIFYKQTWWGTLLSLIGFSLFLIYVAVFRGSENCHCFGDFVELDTIPSLIKNMLLIGILLPIRKQEEWHHNLKPYIVTIACSAALFVAFLGYPMNSMYSLMFGNDEERFNKELYDKVISIPEYEQEIDSSKNQLVAFVSSTCKHCKAGNTILQAIITKNDIPINTITCFIASKNDSLIDSFKIITKSEKLHYKRASMGALIGITNGYFPTYLFLEKGIPSKAVSYKDLDEQEIVDFLKK
ncbi:MAG: DoxX family protein [Bacteroidales bacterium]|nr:DoxX family protein [Bacteroidales bacterium]